MQPRVPTVVREETDESVGKSNPEGSESTENSSEDEETLDEIIDVYAE